MARTPADFSLTFSSVAGRTYRFEAKDNFVLPTWTLLQDQINATGGPSAAGEAGGGRRSRLGDRASGDAANGAARGEYQHGDVGSYFLPTRVSRADVADFMLNQLHDDFYFGTAPGICY